MCMRAGDLRLIGIYLTEPKRSNVTLSFPNLFQKQLVILYPINEVVQQPLS